MGYRPAYPSDGIAPIPQQRVVEKLDEYMSRRDYAGAERHLLYWLEEARAGRDARGELMLRNELVGHFRKTGDGERAMEHGRRALELVDELGFGETISAGTTYTNVATACNAFGHNETALELFRKATRLYEGAANTDARLLGGLYNNMALTCVALGRFDEADDLYQRALHTMSRVEHGALEQAITYLNMADALEARAKAEGGGHGGGPGADVERGIQRCLDTALELLDDPTVPHDGYYAFVCEKCAPSFAYHGYFLADDDLRARAKEIYERA